MYTARNTAQGDALLVQYALSRAPDIRDRIVEAYLYIAEIVARKFSGRGVDYDDLVSEVKEESSASVKARADAARKIQRARFEDSQVQSNAEMGEKETREYCRLTPECESVLREAFESLHLSARARSRILKVARTIADLELCEDITPDHLYEAISYRTYGAEINEMD